MRRRSAFLVLWVSALVLLSCSEGKRGKSFTVEVPCALTWSRSGVVLTPGQRITLVAEGELRGGEWRFGPEGTNDHPQWTRYSLVPEWPHLALIAKVGEDGDPFLVGRRFSGTVIRGGELYLGINDLDAENNDGSFEVTVTVEENR